MRKQFADAEFQFGLEIALGAAYRQACAVGESLATADRIADGDSDSWVDEWTSTAEVSQTAGAKAESAGRTVSALAYYRRAATYYATALYRFSGATDHSPEHELDLWRRQRACWERVVDLQTVPGERISIPYEDTTLEGFFFRAPDAAPGEQRPLVVMNNGSDGATSAMWLEDGAGAAKRGYHWMTFDGPGQQAALYEQNIPFRHDCTSIGKPPAPKPGARACLVVDDARTAVSYGSLANASADDPPISPTLAPKRRPDGGDDRLLGHRWLWHHELELRRRR